MLRFLEEVVERRVLFTSLAKSEEWRVESEELLDRHAKHLVGLVAVLQVSLAPAPRDGADHPKVKKQGLFHVSAL